MSTCCTCGRHLRKKGHYCGPACKSAALATAAGFQRAARNKHYASLQQAHLRLTHPTEDLRHEAK